MIRLSPPAAASPSLLRGADVGPSRIGPRPFLLEIIGPREIDPAAIERLRRHDDLLSFCALLGRSGLAPLAYDRLRQCGVRLSRGVTEWLETQYLQTKARNLVLGRRVREVTAELAGAGIPVMVLKGPPLANAYLAPEALDRMEPFYPLRVFVCDRCFLVQLEDYVTPETLARAGTLMGRRTPR